MPIQQNAFIWGSLQSVLVAAGLGTALQGWKLTEAIGISANGQVIVGTGIDPKGITEGWIATIPEPPSMGLTIIALLTLLTTRVFLPAAGLGDCVPGP